MTRLTLCAALLLSLQTRPSAAGVGAPEVYPNILLIVSEDNGPELGCYGDPYVRTPNLDKLAGYQDMPEDEQVSAEQARTFLSATRSCR